MCDSYSGHGARRWRSPGLVGSGALIGVLALLAGVGLVQRAAGTSAEASSPCDGAAPIIDQFEGRMTTLIAEGAPDALLRRTTEAFVVTVAASAVGECAITQTHAAAAAASLLPLCPPCAGALGNLATPRHGAAGGPAGGS